MVPFHRIQAAFPTLPRRAPVSFYQSSLSRGLTRHCRRQLGLRRTIVAVSSAPASATRPHAIAIAFDENRIWVHGQDGLIEQKPNEVLHRVAGVLSVVAGMSPLQGARLIADISDGEEGEAGLISFCSRDSNAILIPDHIFIRTRGYEAERAVARNRITGWDDRSNRIAWRGSTTGAGLVSKPRLSTEDPELIARVRLCLALKGVPDTDVKVSGVTQSADKNLDADRLARAGILGDFISPICWYGSKFAIDIDGNSNAWSNFFTRLVMGCCVLKVASADGYRQWYYGDIKPWIHYVPVKADLSDLLGQIAWCRTNLAACRDIAARGQEFAMARDFDSEVAAAQVRIGAAHADGRLRAWAGSSPHTDATLRPDRKTRDG
jgi:hypothetical protein